LSIVFFFSSRRRHTRFSRDWSSDVCSSDLLRTGQPLQHALRSVFGICGIGCYFYALGRIPIADATALTYSAPLFLVLLAILFLEIGRASCRERVESQSAAER